MVKLLITFVLGFAVVSATARASDSVKVDADRVNRIAAQLIAPCCWSQSADAHQSEAAKKIKMEIAASLAAGRSEPEIIASYVEQYGERILSTPRAKGFNMFLWVAPFVVIAAGGIALIVYMRKTNNRKRDRAETKIEDSSSPDSERIERELKSLDD